MKPREVALVDTDVYSYLQKPSSAYAKLYLPHVEGKRLAVSFITVGELYCGAIKKGWSSDRMEDMKDRLRSVAIVPYDQEVCMKYGEIKAKLEKLGTPLAGNDLWIAACVIRHSLPLISNNRKHFQRVPGLLLISEAIAVQETQAQLNLDDKAASIASPQQT